MSNSQTRYRDEYLQTARTYLDHGVPPETAQDAALLARRAAWKRARRNYRVQVCLFAVCVLAFCGTLGWAAVSVAMGYGQ